MPALKKKKKRRVLKKRTIKRKTIRKKPVKTLKVKSKKETPIGKVTHYFPRVKAGIIKITKDSIVLGDTLKIKGHTTDFTQKVDSIQINHVAVKKANKGDEIGLLVSSRVRANDLVFKVK